ncbi:hypothetical protein M0D21_00790 [Aquimarina sp. D1M17]|uniref:hypothetical protein n=1 Tax=Aquimarina acroporae TaxID=2937283 RepID=UPI0020BD58AA|nr:hypothetical protein [Aquimarina acroporae]MCK8520086.1 hypothetical protein [Aquimarina acroporae]
MDYDLNFYSLLFGFVGVVGLIVGLVNYSRRIKSKYKQEIYEKYIGIQIDKENIDELIKKKLDLEQQVHQNIPKLGKSIVLNEEIKYHQDKLYESYHRIQDLSTKLGELEVYELIQVNNPEIINYIKEKLYPEYSKKRISEESMAKILSFLAIIITIQIIVPIEFELLFLIPFGFFLTLETLFYLFLQSNGGYEIETLFKNVRRLIMWISVSFLIYGIYNLYEEVLLSFSDLFDLDSLLYLFEDEDFLIYSLPPLTIGLLLLAFRRKISNHLKRRIMRRIDGKFEV